MEGSNSEQHLPEDEAEQATETGQVAEPSDKQKGVQILEPHNRGFPQKQAAVHGTKNLHTPTTERRLRPSFSLQV